MKWSESLLGYSPLATLGRYDEHTESQAERYDIIHTINKEKAMFIKRNKKLNNHKRGFTLAESVLALAIISITSVGTLSLILSAQRSTISATQKQQAQLYAADIISCYRVSANDTDFANNVNFALDINDFTLDKNVDLQGDLRLNASVENSTLTVIVHNGDPAKPLVKQAFTKGGA